MLSNNAAFSKDKRNAKSDSFQHRHFAAIAAIIFEIDEAQRTDIAKHFADKLAATNRNFDRHRFLRAALESE